MVEGRTRDLAMFNLAIDSKLRGCYVVALKVEGIAPNGYAIDRAMVRQRKTGRPVKFELTDQTRQAADDYLRAASKVRGQSGRSLPDVPQQLRADIVAKSPKLPDANISAVKKSDRRLPVDVASTTLPRSPASLSSGDEVPHIFTRNSRVQPKEILLTSAK